MARSKPAQLPEAAPGRPARAARRLGHIDYKWVALAVTSLGVLMSAIDNTIVVLGLPVMVQDLHASLVSMVWVIMGYTLVSTASLLVLGRVADMFGRVRMYNLGFVVFTVASVLCGVSRSGAELIAFRLLQGLGSALLMVNSIAIITEAFPREQRGQALGLNSVVWNAGSILGPLVGGLLLAGFSWRYLFFVNLPIGAAGTIAAYLLLKELSARGRAEAFDLRGAALFTAGITAVLLVLTQGLSLGFTSAPILALLAFGVASLVLFWRAEHRIAHPVLDLRLFASRLFGAAVAAASLQALAMYAVSFLIAYYLEAVKGRPALATAVLMLPMPILGSLVGPFSGRWSDRIGTRLPATLGLLLQGAAVLWLSQLRTGSGYWAVLAPLALLGLGSGLFWSPNTSAAMGSAPANRLGIASATLSTLRNVGFLLSYALAIAVAAESLPPAVMNALFLDAGVRLGAPDMAAFTTGMDHAFQLSFLLALLAAGASVLRGPRAPAAAEPAAQ